MCWEELQCFIMMIRQLVKLKNERFIQGFHNKQRDYYHWKHILLLRQTASYQSLEHFESLYRILYSVGINKVCIPIYRGQIMKEHNFSCVRCWSCMPISLTATRWLTIQLILIKRKIYKYNMSHKEPQAREFQQRLLPLVKRGSGSFLKKDLSKLLITFKSFHFCPKIENVFKKKKRRRRTSSKKQRKC